MAKKIVSIACLIIVVLAGMAYAERGGGVVAITDFSDREIFMYKKPGGKAFDALILQKQAFEYGMFTVFYTLNDSLVFVHAHKDGWQIMEDIRNSTKKEAAEIIKNPEYMLEFAVAVEPEGRWVQIIPYISPDEKPVNIDGAAIGGKFKPPASFYIEYDPAYMRYY